ncbi:Arabinogalactan endo-1,4-beta-galactosidase precursor [compost metagenome]
MRSDWINIRLRKLGIMALIFMIALTGWGMSFPQNEAAAASALSDPGTFIKGVDISTLQALEAKGIKYYENGQEKDLLAILKEHGVNYVRLRVWNDPTESDGFNNKEKLLELAPRIKAAGFKLLVDFHYSDFWADPGKQVKPAAWANLDFESLKTAVYTYTSEVLTELDQVGAYPDMVQVGNEINSGILLPDGAVGNFTNLAALLNEGIQAVRDTTPDGHSVKIMLHLAEGGNNAKFRSFFDKAKANNLDYDVIGMSYYPYWHGTLQQLKTNMDDMATRYGKEVVVAETAYPFTLDDADNAGGNIAGQKETDTAGFPASVANQKLVTEAVMNTVAHVTDGKGLGVFYWEPAWLSGVGWKTGDVNGWENQAMFDFEGNALDSLDAFQYVPGSLDTSPIKVYPSDGITIVKGVQPELPQTADVLYNDGSITSAPVVWDSIPADSLNTPGTFTVKGKVSGLDEEASIDIKVLANQNVILNPGFEDGLTNWTVTGTAAGKVEKNAANAHTGSSAFNYWYASNYAYKVSQTITGLENGVYTLRAWSSGGGGETKLRLFADGFGGDALGSDAVNTGWNVWKQYTVENIHVTNGQITVGFDVEAPAQAWGYFDDFELIKASQPSASLTGGDVTKAPGDEFGLTFGLSNLEKPFLTEEMTLRFDPSRLEFLGASPLVSGLEVVQQTANDDGSSVYLVLASTAGTVSGNPSLLDLRFKVKDGATSGAATVTAVNVSVSDGEDITASTGASASITVAAVADKAALLAGINSAEEKYNATKTGAFLGGYGTESRNAFQGAIAAAKQVYNNAEASQNDVNSASSALTAAVQTYLDSAYTLETLGVPVTIKDLASVSKGYGKTSADSDWYLYKPLDANKDNVINIADLAATAKKIPGKF